MVISERNNRSGCVLVTTLHFVIKIMVPHSINKQVKCILIRNNIHIYKRESLLFDHKQSKSILVVDMAVFH